MAVTVAWCEVECSAIQHSSGYLALVDHYPLQLVVADDHALVRLGVRAALAEHALRLQIVAEAADGDGLLAIMASAVRVDVVITDFAMTQDGQDGLRLLRRLRTQYPDVGVVVLTMLNNPALLQTVMDLGISCIVSKRSLSGDLPLAIEQACKRRSFVSPDIKTMLSEGGTLPRRQDAGEPAKLSPRESEVLRLIQSGMSLTEIARKLDRSIKTVSTQKQAAMAKLGVKNDAQLHDYLVRFSQ